jgi:hypothetical protein
MFVLHDSIQELPGAPQHAPFPKAPPRVARLPEYFMYCNYLKRLGTRQVSYRCKFLAGFVLQELKVRKIVTIRIFLFER